MDKKKSLSFNSVSNFSSKRFEINKQNKKIETVIDLTLSDDDETESNKRISSSNPNPITKNPKKKLKLSHSKTFSFDSSDDDDELSDNIYSLFPISQEYDIKKRRNIRGIQSKKKSELQEEKKTISIPNKRRKEYKLSNVQNSLNWFFDNTQNKSTKKNKETKNEKMIDNNNIETQLWIDKFIPQNSNELAVNKRKVDEVRQWLIYNIINNRTRKPSLLILSGPSGSGKTATLKVLAEELNIEIIEWTNPVNTLKISETKTELNLDDYDTSNYKYWKNMNDTDDTSITEKFKHFFISANKYPSLQFEYQSSEHSKSNEVLKTNPYIPKTSEKIKNYKYKIILLEDVPLLTNLKTRKNFQSLIQSYFNSSKSTYSLIFIISEILSIEDDFSKKQDFTIKTYIPSSVLNSNICHIINFNPVAETIIAKSLKNLSEKALPPSKQLDTMILRAIGLHSNGDIRSAINTLQFLYLYENPKQLLQKEERLTILQEIKKEKDQKFRKRGAYNLFSSIFSINDHLTLFHIVGKILYNKRFSQSNNSSITKIKYKDNTDSLQYKFQFTMPDYLKDHERLKLEDEPEDIISQNQIDSSVLMLFLEQNQYPFFEEIEELDDVFKYLCIADQFQNKWNRSNKDFSFYSQYISMYGLLHSHTNPVPRSNKLNKIYRPEVWSANKLIQQNNTHLNDILYQWSDHLSNSFKIPFKIENTSKSKIMTEVFPYLSKIISKPNHILNRELNFNDKQFINYTNNYTNPRTENNWWSNLNNGYEYQPKTMKENALDDEIDDEINNNDDQDNQDNNNNNYNNNNNNNTNFNNPKKLLSLSSSSILKNNSINKITVNNKFNNKNTYTNFTNSTSTNYYNTNNNYNNNNNNNNYNNNFYNNSKIKANENLFEVENDEIESD